MCKTLIRAQHDGTLATKLKTYTAPTVMVIVAAAILDRLMHKAIVFNIRGPSWRLREHNGLEIATTNPDR